MFVVDLVNVDSLPIIAKWIPYISVTRWSFQVNKSPAENIILLLLAQALCINEFKGVKFHCPAGFRSICVPSGDAVIESLSFERQDLADSVLGLAILFVINLTLAYLLFKAKTISYISLGHMGVRQDKADKIS